MTYGTTPWAAQSFASVPAAPATGRRIKHYGKAYLKRDNEILVFPSEEAKDEFLEAEAQAAQQFETISTKRPRSTGRVSLR